MSSRLNRRDLMAGLAAAGLGAQMLPGASTFAATGKKAASFSPIDRSLLEDGAPLHIVISIEDQMAHVYAGTHLAGSSRISSGKPGHETPHGIFTVMEKRRHHRSNIYSNAPMPYMQRLTWSGIALHEGKVPNRPASHGCVRLPRGFAADLFALQTRNRHVIITGHMPEPYAISSDALFQPRLPETASLDPASGTDATAENDDAAQPVRIYLTRHTGQHRLERVQHMLARLGFYEGEQDGLMGRATWRALLEFQKSAGLKPSGVIRGATLPVLEAAFGIKETPAGHLYVRQGQQPVFDLPVSLDMVHVPLGTHLFSMGQPDDISRKASWVSLSLEGNELGGAGAALQALKRFDIPADARARIERMLTPHSSIAISDTGLGPETGEGTDFIVITR